MMTREEHLAWAKSRAMEYWYCGDFQSAYAQMCGDLNSHEETKTSNKELQALGLIYVMQNDADGLRRWIEGWR